MRHVLSSCLFQVLMSIEKGRSAGGESLRLHPTVSSWLRLYKIFTKIICTSQTLNQSRAVWLTSQQHSTQVLLHKERITLHLMLPKQCDTSQTDTLMNLTDGRMLLLTNGALTQTYEYCLCVCFLRPCFFKVLLVMKFTTNPFQCKDIRVPLFKGLFKGIAAT